MNTRYLLVFLAALSMQPACAAAFNPSELKGFPQDTLTIERKGGRDSISIWVADTPARSQQGLMWIRRLPPGYGMLFIVDPPRTMNMWMRNTYVSLDMLFLAADGRIVKIAPKTTPLSEAIVSSDQAVSGVLELAAGEAQKRGIAQGDRVIHRIFRPSKP